MSADAGIEPRTVATLALTARLANHQLDLIHIRLHLIHNLARSLRDQNIFTRNKAALICLKNMDGKSNEKTIKDGRLKVLHVIDLAQHRTGHSTEK